MFVPRKFLKRFIIVLVILGFVNVIYILSRSSGLEVIFSSSSRGLVNKKIDWEDHFFINYELTRFGPGELGEPYIVTDPDALKRNQEWVNKEGFFVEVSNNLSLTRSLPDWRPKVCATQKYFESLPNVSVIVTFHNEIFSTLLRCIYSIYNRSPKSLLHEIILVNDRSTFEYLYEPLREYLRNAFGKKVKLIENKERQGLIKARMTGAKSATGEVIVFLDSHMEVYNSWLPPLLDPIVTNPNIATVPVCDGISHDTFQPVHIGYGYRGMFDWNFRYQWLPLRAQDKAIQGAPYELPCLTGGAYAIRRDHFFHLGGYDEGLMIWNGENWELCIKLWLCSGGLYEIPCSRVAHLSKLHSAYRNTDKPIDFIGRNLKRVAEVWLDDYKQYFYRGDLHRYEKLDPGDLTEQFKKKESLNCKPFQYYLDVVAPDMLQRYPIFPTHFAAGKIESEDFHRCAGNPLNSNKLFLMDCKAHSSNNFVLTLERSIKYDDTNDQCLNAESLTFSNCHHQFRGQYWKFDIQSRQIFHVDTKNCLTSLNNGTIYLTSCNPGQSAQRWKWSYENKTALMDWDNFGIKMN